MSYLWSIYGNEIKKKRRNAFLTYLFGEVTVDRKKEWMSVIQTFFADFEIEQMNFSDCIKLYLKNHPSVASINLGRTHIDIYFNEDFIPHFNSFIEQMFPGEPLGICFSGCEVTQRNNKIVSIKHNEVELFRDGLDQLKNMFFSL
jgi:hypothetical protein